MQLRDLPKVDELAGTDELAGFEPAVRVACARTVIERFRRAILAGKKVQVGDLPTIAREEAERFSEPSLPGVINMSGTILHTGLGRARLAEAAVQAIQQAARDHVAVELDLDSSARGDRQEHVSDLLKLLTGAEDAIVVNNGAAALVLALRTLADGKNVLLSRGQMVEIGGSFRVPDIVRESGCQLVEVGCTNKTHMADYKVDADTGAILVCHKSNYEVVGFASEPSISHLAALSPPVVHDMGTGCLVDLTQFGLGQTWTLADSIRAGAAIAIGSGDKLLGGPQAGLIVGKAAFLEKIRRHPLARAFRVDKLTLAGMRATLSLYVQGQYNQIPTLRYLSRPVSDVEKACGLLGRAIGEDAILEPAEAEIGGGSGAEAKVPSFRVGFGSRDAEEVAMAFRRMSPATLGRIQNGVFWLDPRTAEDAEVDKVAANIRECLR